MRTRFAIGSGGFVYAVVATLILVAAWLTQANLLFWSFGLMIGGLVVSIFISWYSLRRIELERLPPEHAVAGEPMVLRYRLLNQKRWMPSFNLVIRETWGDGPRGWRREGPLAHSPPRLSGFPHGWVVHLGPRQFVQAEAICWPRRRGTLELERIVLSSTFPFGIIRRVVEYEQPGEIRVFPALYRISRTLWYRLSVLDPAGHLQIDHAGGSEEFFGLRQYRPGDNLRSIDWRHSAKTGQLICREMTQPSPPRIMLLLDLTGMAPLPPAPPPRRRTWFGHAAPVPRPHAAGLDDPAERAICLAASLLCGAHLQGYQIGLAVQGADCGLFRVHHSLPHRARILDALSLLDIAKTSEARLTMPVEPTITITLGDRLDGQGRRPSLPSASHDAPSALGRPVRRGRSMVLSADQLDELTRDQNGASAELLARGVAARSKRQHMAQGGAWT
ncbi:MAG: DUF58 domain-containing protein [Phycisphaeraceae bacterium]